MGRTRFEAAIDKRRAVVEAEAVGQVADSIDVRGELVRRMEAGEITHEQALKELAKIKRDAKKQGKVTRAQAFNRG